MGSKVDFYIQKLRSLKDWDNYLLAESGLPGPRGNLELAQAFAEIGNENLIQKYIAIKPEEAPGNSANVFLTFCGVVGLGTLITRGKINYLADVRRFASDPRWRIREAVAMALQRVGDADMSLAFHEAKELSRGNFLEKRAAAAALCEPRLLKSEGTAGAVLDVLDDITSSIVGYSAKNDETFDVLKKGLAYCWSVAVVASPEKGKKLMEKWVQIRDKNIAWIMKENLEKNRLLKMDKDWVKKQMKQINSQRDEESC
jgi:HEAT repeat protein